MKFSIFFLINIFTLFFLSPLNAQETSVTAELETRSIYIGDSTTLSLIVQNAEGKIELPSKQFNGFDVVQNGTQTFDTTRIINGSMTRSIGRKVNLTLTAKKSGRYDWPHIQILINGKLHRSNSLALMVRDVEKQDNVILLLESEFSEAFLQQKIKITLKILLKAFKPPHDNVEPIILGREPHLSIPWFEEKEGFISQEDVSSKLTDLLTEEGGFQINTYSRRAGIFSGNQLALFNLPQTFVTHQGLDGRTHNYLQYILESQWLPISPGTHSFSPVSFKGIFPTEISSERGNLVINKKKEIRTISNVLEITVRDVPQQGRPMSYTGAIGEFSIASSIDRVNLQVGEPLLMTITVSGNGLLDPVAMPSLKTIQNFSENFRIYSDNPDGEIQGNQKIFQATLRPLNPEITQIPQIPFTYFDTNKKDYVTIKSSPLPISVSSANYVDAQDIISNLPDTSSSEAIKLREKGLIEAMTAPAILKTSTSSSRLPMIFQTLNVLLIIFLITFNVYTHVIHPRKDNESTRLAKTAISRARQNIQLLKNSSAPETIESVGQILLTCLAEKFFKQASSYTRDDALKDLREHLFDSIKIEQTLHLIDLANEVRFGAGTLTNSEQIKEDSLKILKDLESLS